MRIAYFFQYYHNPDCPSNGRHYTFIKHLSRHHDVHLITTDAYSQERCTQEFDWVPANVQVDTLHVPYRNEMTTRQRGLSFARYALKGLTQGVLARRPDVVFGTSTPLTAAWAAAKVARWHHAPFVFEIRDLWPDFPIEIGALRHTWAQKWAYRLERNLYRQAAHVVALSPDMAAHVVRLGKPPREVSTLVHGTDFDLRDAGLRKTPPQTLREELGLVGKNVLLYAGTFGRANDTPGLIALAEQFQHREDVVFLFTGAGYHEDTLKQASERLPNLRLLPPQPRHRIFSFFGMATLSLVSFLELPVLSANSPAKLFDSLGCGTPVVVMNAGWTKAFVEDHGCGWYLPHQPVKERAIALEAILDDETALKAAARRAEATALRHFDRSRLAEKFEALLLDAAGR